MNKLLVKLLIFTFLTPAYGECDFSKGITPGPNNTFIYTQACHQKVGKMVQDIKTKDKQIADLFEAITMKDLSIQAADKRVALWMETSQRLEDRLQKIDSLEKQNEFWYFVLGVGTAVATGYVASQFYRR